MLCARRLSGSPDALGTRHWPSWAFDRHLGALLGGGDQLSHRVGLTLRGRPPSPPGGWSGPSC